jgi:hypothetical protein
MEACTLFRFKNLTKNEGERAKKGEHPHLLKSLQSPAFLFIFLSYGFLW